MKYRLNPYIITAVAMMTVLMVAVYGFFQNARAGDSAARITEDEAREIALNDAGVSLDQVTFTKTSLDDDSGVPIYEVDFYDDDTQYDYEINAQTGVVREKEVVVHQKTRKNTASKTETQETTEAVETKNLDVIGVEKAQAAALKAAGLKEKEVTFTKTSLETDDGRMIYEIDFTVSGKKYEYDVDAYSGKILESDIDVVKSVPVQNSSKDAAEKNPVSQDDRDDDDDDDHDDSDRDDDDDDQYDDHDDDHDNDDDDD